MEPGVETGIVIELAVAEAVFLASVLVGYWAQRSLGALILGSGAALAGGLCIGGTLLGQRLGDKTGAWWGLAAGILLTGLLAWRAGNKVVRGKAGRFAAGLWFGLCALCVFGYWAGGWIGLVAISVPALAVFWNGLFRVSAYLLPRRDEDNRPLVRLYPKKSYKGPRPQCYLLPPQGLVRRVRDYFAYWRRSQWRKSYRSLLTFTMGTNYPYYFVRDGHVEERVPGNPYNQFFAGPGLVYADCDQVAYLSDGVKVKGILPPGLNFTGMFDREPKAVDLRPQLCSFQVKAITKDGIPLSVEAFVAFQAAPGECVDPQRGVRRCRPEFEQPFPYLRRAIYRIATREPVEPAEGEAEAKGTSERYDWATELVPQITTRLLQELISRWKVDDLCAALDLKQQPCQEILTDLRPELRKALFGFGLDLVEIWLGDLLPTDESIIDRRRENWRTEWERKIMLWMTEGKAERARQFEEARAKAELNVLVRFSQVAQASGLGDAASQTALALRFIDCMGEIISESEGQWPLPESVRETLRTLRGEIEEGQR